MWAAAIMLIAGRCAMTDVLIRNVPDHILETLKKSAADHEHSLQQELLNALEEAVRLRSREEHLKFADEMRERLAKSGRTFTDSVDLIREDRER
jgi:plasmid stability protein